MVDLIRNKVLPKVVLAFCFLFFSCSENNEGKEELDRIRNEHRDPELIGKWVGIDMKTNKKHNQGYKLFKQNADFTVVSYENDSESKMNYYFYTKNDNLYIYMPGEGFKARSSIIHKKYTVIKDTLIVKTKDGDFNYKAVKVF